MPIIFLSKLLFDKPMASKSIFPGKKLFPFIQFCNFQVFPDADDVLLAQQAHIDSCIADCVYILMPMHYYDATRITAMYGVSQALKTCENCSGHAKYVKTYCPFPPPPLQLCCIKKRYPQSQIPMKRDFSTYHLSAIISSIDDCI